MLRYALRLIFIVGMSVGAPPQEAQAAGGTLQPILEVLDNAKLSASLEFSGRCEPAYPPDLPQFHAAATSGDTPLQVLREMFGADSAMRVTQDPDGTIRMKEIGTPTDLLNVRISHISFEGHGGRTAYGPTQNGVYTPNDALSTILLAPEVVGFMKTRGIETLKGSSSVPGSAGPWPPQFPHISGSMDNVTVAEALDRVLKTFPGVWYYENCQQTGKKNRVVRFRFQYLQKMAGRVLVVE